VVGCFVECNGKILQLQRHPDKLEGLSFGRPSGKVDAGDSDRKSAMARELFEETGIQVSPEKFEDVALFYVVNEPLNKNFKYYNYRLTLSELPEIKLNPAEHIAYVWVDEKEAFESKLMVEEDNCLKYFYGTK
jgi:8-oxo-dGTP pyrophosphatase MutT (NUDIX family)